MPYQLFRMLFDDEIFDILIEESIRYATQKNNLNFSLTRQEMKNILSIILFRRYHSLLHEDMYWNKSDDCYILFISVAMSRQHFMILKNIFIYAITIS